MVLSDVNPDMQTSDKTMNSCAGLTGIGHSLGDRDSPSAYGECEPIAGQLSPFGILVFLLSLQDEGCLVPSNRLDHKLPSWLRLVVLWGLQARGTV